MRIAVPVPGVAQRAIALRGCTYSPSQKRFPCGVSRRRCRWSGRTPPRSEKSLRVVSLSHQRAVHALDNILEAAPGARRFHRGSGSACGATRRHVGKRKRSTAVSPFNPRAKGSWRKVSSAIPAINSDHKRGWQQPYVPVRGQKQVQPYFLRHKPSH